MHRDQRRLLAREFAREDRHRTPYGRWARGAWTFGLLACGVYLLMLDAGGSSTQRVFAGQSLPAWAIALGGPYVFAALFCGVGWVFRWRRQHPLAVQTVEVTIYRSGRRVERFLDPVLWLLLVFGSLPIGLVVLPYYTVQAVKAPALAVRRYRERQQRRKELLTCFLQGAGRS